jgi:hypothetical protein
MQADQHRIRLEADGVLHHVEALRQVDHAIAIDGLYAAVSSVTPSPTAPKSRTLAHCRSRAAAHHRRALRRHGFQRFALDVGGELAGAAEARSIRP